MAAIRSTASAFPLANIANTGTTLSVTGVTLGATGDLIIVDFIYSSNLGIGIPTVTAGGLTFSQVGTFTDAPAFNEFVRYQATIDAPDAGATVDFNASFNDCTGGYVYAAVDDFSSGLGANTIWTVADFEGIIGSTASTTLLYPSCTSPSSGTIMLYYGVVNFGAVTVGASPVNGVAFLYEDVEGTVYNTANLAHSTAYQPSWTQSPASQWDGVASIWGASTGSVISHKGNFMQFMNGGSGPNPNPPPPPPPEDTGLHGMYEDPQGNWQAVTAFQTQTGAPMSVTTQYVGSSTYGGLINDFNYLMGLLSGCPYRLAVSIQMVAPNAGSFASVGSNLSTHQYMASQLKAQFPNAIVRLGWELNIGTTTQIQPDPNGFVTAWNQAAPIYRNAGLLVDFNTCPNNYYNFEPVLAQIINNVDIISSDPYDQFYGTLPNGSSTPNNQPTYSSYVWNQIETAPYDGLNALYALAVQYDKQMAFPEWGVGEKGDGHGLGDDPNYVTSLAAWIAAHQSVFLYDSYFNDDPNGSWDTILGDQPNSLAAYKAAFG